MQEHVFLLAHNFSNQKKHFMRLEPLLHEVETSSTRGWNLINMRLEPHQHEVGTSST